MTQETSEPLKKRPNPQLKRVVLIEENDRG
jgi:hypothetical protein